LGVRDQREEQYHWEKKKTIQHSRTKFAAASYYLREAPLDYQFHQGWEQGNAPLTIFG
jgi:hypothetical protein